MHLTLMQKLGIGLLILVSVIAPSNGFSTVEYARQTGKGCGDCHIESAGGGPLTNAGEAFRDDLRIRGLYRPLTPMQHAVRFVVGFLHTITAIIWFGTILYVHILLKPAYAARGLPKGELMLGWGSIVIMAVTGTMLSIARVPSWHALFHTRFGILLTIKVLLFLVMVVTAVIVTFIIGPRLRKKRGIAVIGKGQDLTPEELSQCDGSGGRPAYIAYRGTIYDVSASRFWKDGVHLKKHRSGADLSEILGTAPHGEDRLFRMPEVGKLVAGKAELQEGRPKLFYFLAYMNLAIVFIIVFVISLWRWW